MSIICLMHYYKAYGFMQNINYGSENIRRAITVPYKILERKPGFGPWKKCVFTNLTVHSYISV